MFNNSLKMFTDNKNFWKTFTLKNMWFKENFAFNLKIQNIEITFKNTRKQSSSLKQSKFEKHLILLILLKMLLNKFLKIISTIVFWKNIYTGHKSFNWLLH